MIELFEYAKQVGNSAALNLIKLIKQGPSYKIKTKEDNSPLFNFDLLMNDYICFKLKKTGYQVISEESFKKGQILNSQYWILDPIDGSKEINSNQGRMSINISFINNNHPVFGVINVINASDYSSKQYFGFVEDDFQYQVFKSKKTQTLKKINLIQSKFHLNDYDKKFNKVNKFESISKYSSAYKFVKIALSENDIYVRFEGSSEWDTAAGQAIIESNNGKVVCLRTLQRLKYGKPSLRNTAFIAFRKGIEIENFNSDSLKIELHENNNFSSR